MNKVYEYPKLITTGDVDISGHLFFANHFYLAAEARESWVSSFVPGGCEALLDNVWFAVREASCVYMEPIKLFDEITVVISCLRISSVSFGLNFAYLNKKTNVIHAISIQKLVCVIDGKFGRIPDIFREKIKEYVA